VFTPKKQFFLKSKHNTTQQTQQTQKLKSIAQKYSSKVFTQVSSKK